MVHQPTLGKVTLTLVRLLSQNMTFVRMLALQHSRTSERKTLHRAAVRFHLWHPNNYLYDKTTRLYQSSKSLCFHTLREKRRLFQSPTLQPSLFTPPLHPQPRLYLLVQP